MEKTNSNTTESADGEHSNQRQADTQRLSSETDGGKRFGCVRLVLPGHENPSVRRKQPLPLDDAVVEILESRASIDWLEILIASGIEQENYFFIGHWSANTHDRALDHALGRGKGITEYGESDGEESQPTGADSPSDEINDYRTKTILQTLEETLPGNIRPQECDLDLSPLGTIPIPTSRLLQPPGRSLTQIDAGAESAICNLVTSLSTAALPHLVQICLKQAPSSKDHDYLVSARLAVFEDGVGIASEHELGEHLAERQQYDIAQFFEGPSSSNFNLPVAQYLREYRNTSSGRYNVVEQVDKLSIRPGTIKDLATGFPEYDDGLRGVFDADDRYEELFDGYARIPIQRSELLHFCMLRPAYYEYNPWDRTVSANRIQISTEQISGRVPGTRQAFGSEDTAPTIPDDDRSDEESTAHQELLRHRLKFLLRQGHDIIAVDQQTLAVDIEGADPTETSYFDGPSQPDIVSKKNGQVYLHEIEVGNESKPASLLMNLARAVHYDLPVTVVAPDRASAKQEIWGLEPESDSTGPIREPFKRVDGATHLYTWTDPVSTEQVTYLLPASLSESRWRLQPSGRLQLLDDDDSPLADGEAGHSVADLNYSTPRYYNEGGSYIVEAASGEELGRYTTVSALLEDYTRVRLPFVPTRHSYIPSTAVEYQEGDRFKQFRYEPEWVVRYQEQNSSRYEAAVKDFLQSYTVPEPETRLSQTYLRQQFLPWYRAQTDLTAPNDTWFGRAINANFDTEKTNKQKYLVGRQLRYPTGLESPDLSFITDGGETEPDFDSDSDS